MTDKLSTLDESFTGGTFSSTSESDAEVAAERFSSLRTVTDLTGLAETGRLPAGCDDKGEAVLLSTLLATDLDLGIALTLTLVAALALTLVVALAFALSFGAAFSEAVCEAGFEFASTAFGESDHACQVASVSLRTMMKTKTKTKTKTRTRVRTMKPRPQQMVLASRKVEATSDRRLHRIDPCQLPSTDRHHCQQ